MKDDTKNKLLVGVIGIVLIVAIISAATSNKTTPKYIINDKQIFTDIYEKNKGEEGLQTESTKNAVIQPFVEYLQGFIDTHEISSIIDMGCGYGELMKAVQFPKNTEYLGLDIVDGIIDYNKKNYARDNVEFATVNTLEDLAAYQGDLLILKDVMQHWTTAQVIYTRDYIIPNFRYAIIVNDIWVQGSAPINSEINVGGSRPLDLEIVPFSMKLKHIGDYDSSSLQKKRVYLYVNDNGRDSRMEEASIDEIQTEEIPTEIPIAEKQEI